MRKPLLNVDSEKYRRRLVRELNQHDVNGFYFTRYGVAYRSTRARLHRGVLECRPQGGESFVVPTDPTFTDHNGREICASRQP